ncbi:serine hydrolase [Clostridium gelidum]|uniref:Serine hydrolase n=1 Tax=Clostridium gelidum TaxID=704125 RepID=A0ABM7T573_9CLOT|nr:serine hydrolase [Clostridium gelidum]BCZ46388.1 serine hydrolase [Clostridium gelidum]
MLENELKEIIKKCDEDIAMLVKNLSSNEILFNYNEEKMYPSASIIKIPIMIEALSKADDLQIPLLSTIKIKESDKVDFSIITEQNLTECTFLELITCMIINSDNTATNVLIDLLGLNKINEKINSLGMKNTKLQRKMMDFEAIKEGKNNFTSLKDMLVVMEGLYRGEVIDKEVSRRALDIMKNQRDNTMLKRYIVENVVLANKTGELNNLNSDVGIFYTKNTDYFIGVFVHKAKDNNESYEIIGKLSKKVYDYFIDNKNENSDSKWQFDYQYSMFND